MKITILIFSYFLLTVQLYSSISSNVKIVKSTNNILEVAWHLEDLHQSSFEENSLKFTKLYFDGCSNLTVPHKPNLPYKEFIIAVPDGAEINFSVSDIEYDVLENILPCPVNIPELEHKRANPYKSVVESVDYDFIPENKIEVSDQRYFRDLPIVMVKFFPISYNHNNKRINIIKSAKLNFEFKASSLNGKPNRIDKFFEKVILNLDQAKQWSTIQPGKSIKKERKSLEGPWYRIKVTEDGLYKISKSTLSSAGIDVDEIDPRTIKLFNNGGKPLNINAMSSENNPEGPVENAIYVAGEVDGSFDDGDFVLFYGTRLGGWRYSNSLNDFEFIQHPYDTNNFYWLTFGQSIGRRMEEFATSSLPGTINETYFMERLHFEEDEYNLLNSGTDWYGHRFSGLSDNGSFEYTLDNLSSIVRPAKLRVKLKGGSGITFGDNTNYQYCFTFYLNRTINSNPVLSTSCFYSENASLRDIEFSSADFLLSGNNTFYVAYTGNYESCKAYLDWVELFYPRNFSVTNNYLNFYTLSLNQIVNFNIDGFTEDNISLFDVTKPDSVKIVSSQLSAQQGNCSFSLDLSNGKNKRFIATSLFSSSIINIENLTEFTPTINLLDNTLQADLIIITHPDFEENAREIVELRSAGESPLSGIAVNTEDIYFYFSSGVKDPVAIRNFIRYACNYWTKPEPSYILLFGDGHYDYRNLSVSNTNHIPPYEIAANNDLNSRETDNFYADINLNSSSLNLIVPDIAIGRLPVENYEEAQNIVDKLKSYEQDKHRDGWQTFLTFVADDEAPRDEWIHQMQSENLTNIPEIQKFLIKKIYLSAYESVPGGFGRIKPDATEEIINQLNQGTLIINYTGHGSEYVWSHENVLSMERDISRIRNEKRLAFWISATCTFGKFDNAHDLCFSEALIRKRNAGAIGIVSAARPVYSGDNYVFNSRLYDGLYPSNLERRRIGDAYLLASLGSVNYQKFHLFGDPSMYLASPYNYVKITSIIPDTLKALSKVKVSGFTSINNNTEVWQDFTGGAVLIVNDAQYEDVSTGGGLFYDLLGPRVFKGEITVENGLFSGEFIVPKSIRYKDIPSGRVTVYAWNEAGSGEALGSVDTLIFNGTAENIVDTNGPQIDIYFEGQENFNSGDLITCNPVLIAEIFDENGINLTQQIGHSIEIQVDDRPAFDITSFFAYNRNSYTEGKLTYQFSEMNPGFHNLSLEAWDNLNNPSKAEINFRVTSSENLILTDVYNYPNPLTNETHFTFQTQGIDAATEVEIKIYTIAGRLIKTIDGLSPPNPGYNYYHWDARDDDGDQLANGVYLYKIVLKNSDEQTEVIEKLVILN